MRKLEIFYDHASQYQHIRVEGTETYKALRLDNVMQLNTLDSHRYHEALAVVPYLFTRGAKRILIIGGGDGQAAATLLAHYSENIESITILELDAEVVEVSKTFFDFPTDPRVRVLITDAITAIEANKTEKHFDLILMDLTDPTCEMAAHAYTVDFLKHVNRALKPDGVFAMQVEVPVANPYAASCMAATVSASFNRSNTAVYHVHLPFTPLPASNGFVLTSQYPIQLSVPPTCRYLNPASMQAMFAFGNDELLRQVEPATLENNLYTRLYLTPYLDKIETYEEDLREAETDI